MESNGKFITMKCKSIRCLDNWFEIELDPTGLMRVYYQDVNLDYHPIQEEIDELPEEQQYILYMAGFGDNSGIEFVSKTKIQGYE